MQQSVKSLWRSDAVDAHERPRDYVTEDELRAMVESTKRSRYHWRDATMLMLTFYHGLRVSELCHLRRNQVDLKHGHIWIERLKGSLSTQQPLLSQELRALKRYLKQRGDSQLPWLFLSERGNQFTRFTIHYMVRTAAERAGLTFSVHPHMLRHGCGYAGEIRGYLAKGISKRSIAKLVGCAESTLYDWLARRGTEVRSGIMHVKKR